MSKPGGPSSNRNGGSYYGGGNPRGPGKSMAHKKPPGPSSKAPAPAVLPSESRLQQQVLVSESKTALSTTSSSAIGKTSASGPVWGSPTSIAPPTDTSTLHSPSTTKTPSTSSRLGYREDSNGYGRGIGTKRPPQILDDEAFPALGAEPSPVSTSSSSSQRTYSSGHSRYGDSHSSDVYNGYSRPNPSRASSERDWRSSGYSSGSHTSSHGYHIREPPPNARYPGEHAHKTSTPSTSTTPTVNLADVIRKPDSGDWASIEPEEPLVTTSVAKSSTPSATSSYSAAVRGGSQPTPPITPLREEPDDVFLPPGKNVTRVVSTKPITVLQSEKQIQAAQQQAEKEAARKRELEEQKRRAEEEQRLREEKARLELERIERQAEEMRQKAIEKRAQKEAELQREEEERRRKAAELLAKLEATKSTSKPESTTTTTATTPTTTTSPSVTTTKSPKVSSRTTTSKRSYTPTSDTSTYTPAGGAREQVHGFGPTSSTQTDRASAAETAKSWRSNKTRKQYASEAQKPVIETPKILVHQPTSISSPTTQTKAPLHTGKQQTQPHTPSKGSPASSTTTTPLPTAAKEETTAKGTQQRKASPAPSPGPSSSPSAKPASGIVIPAAPEKPVWGEPKPKTVTTPTSLTEIMSKEEAALARQPSSSGATPSSKETVSLDSRRQTDKPTHKAPRETSGRKTQREDSHAESRQATAQGKRTVSTERVGHGTSVTHPGAHGKQGEVKYQTKRALTSEPNVTASTSAPKTRDTKAREDSKQSTRGTHGQERFVPRQHTEPTPTHTTPKATYRAKAPAETTSNVSTAKEEAVAAPTPQQEQPKKEPWWAAAAATQRAEKAAPSTTTETTQTLSTSFAPKSVPATLRETRQRVSQPPKERYKPRTVPSASSSTSDTRVEESGKVVDTGAQTVQTKSTETTQPASVSSTTSPSSTSKINKSGAKKAKEPKTIQTAQTSTSVSSKEEIPAPAPTASATPSATVPTSPPSTPEASTTPKTGSFAKRVKGPKPKATAVFRPKSSTSSTTSDATSADVSQKSAVDAVSSSASSAPTSSQANESPAVSNNRPTKAAVEVSSVREEATRDEKVEPAKEEVKRPSSKPHQKREPKKPRFQPVAPNNASSATPDSSAPETTSQAKTKETAQQTVAVANQADANTATENASSSPSALPNRTATARPSPPSRADLSDSWKVDKQARKTATPPNGSDSPVAEASKPSSGSLTSSPSTQRAPREKNSSANYKKSGAAKLRESPSAPSLADTAALAPTASALSSKDTAQEPEKKDAHVAGADTTAPTAVPSSDSPTPSGSTASGSPYNKKPRQHHQQNANRSHSRGGAKVAQYRQKA